ncbi:MAG: hypothetical protein Q7S45_03010 [Candidatus Curtissbacteria bacterium]|nr:hypothetical protein [Candidatus Curtissbacteria bacterium]
MTVKLDYIRTAERWQRYGEEYSKEGREHWSDFIKACLSVTTFLIGFNGIWLQIRKAPLTDLDKALFFSAFIYLCLSLIFGLWAILEMNAFMNKMGRYYEEKSEALFKFMLDTSTDRGESYPNHLPKKNNKEFELIPWPFKYQLVCLGFGIIASTSLGMLFIFK